MPEWIAGVGASGAFIATATVIVRESNDRRLAPARGVYVVVHRDGRAAIHNTGLHAVHRVEAAINWVDAGRDPTPITATLLPPGIPQEVKLARPLDSVEIMSMVVEFTDHNQRRWRRTISAQRDGIERIDR